MDVQRHHHSAPVRIDLAAGELPSRDRGEVALVLLAGVDQIAWHQSLAASDQSLNGIPGDEERRVLVIMARSWRPPPDEAGIVLPPRTGRNGAVLKPPHGGRGGARGPRS